MSGGGGEDGGNGDDGGGRNGDGGESGEDDVLSGFCIIFKNWGI